MERTSKCTLPAGPAGAIGHRAAGGPAGEPGRRRRPVELHGAGGERRHLFGVGEGPAEAIARRQQCCKTPLSGAGAKGRLSIL